ncbi:MAG: TolC family protein [Lachnospiraceae bacterium]
MKRIRKSAAWGLVGIMGISFPFQASAASPEFSRTAEEWVRLQDDKIEYDELADLIHEYNATVQNNQYEYRKFREDYGDTKSDVSDAYRSLANDFYNSVSGDSDATSMISDLQMETQAKNMLKQADDTLEDSKIYYLTYEQVEKNLVATAQSSMIDYYRKQLELEQQNINLASSQLDLQMANVKQSAGTMTAIEVMQYQQTVQDTQQQIKNTEFQINNTRETFQVSLGWKHNDSPEIDQLPSVDLDAVSQLNPDEDLEEAIANNYTLQINKRKLENATSQTTKESLTSTIQNNERKIGNSLASAYKTVQTKQINYDQAKNTLVIEHSNLSIAATKRQAGVITQSEYQQQVYTTQNSEISVKIAELDLLEALETYEWNVQGLATAE